MAIESKEQANSKSTEEAKQARVMESRERKTENHQKI